MKRMHMTRVVDRVPESRIRRSPEVHERFLGWATLQGIDVKATSTEGIVVIERAGRSWLSVREFIFDDPGKIIRTARTGDHLRVRRCNFPIAALPEWL